MVRRFRICNLHIVIAAWCKRIGGRDSVAMPSRSRADNLLRVTKRLICLTLVALLAIGAIFYGSYTGADGRLMISWMCLACGILGGFVSIQQRLKDINDDELGLLARSFFQIALIPIYGGIFALVLYVAFLGKVVQGDLFPTFVIKDFPKTGATNDDIHTFLTATYPASGPDIAKLLFWTFVAGFSERFVPQIISKQSG
jgi:hypothetical protein